jgi:tyrosyl-tRNA synthetase
VYKSSFLRLLSERGFLYQSTGPSLVDDMCHAAPVTLYYGCDPTAMSLHVGNLMGLMVMRWAQEEGHTPILLVGGGTAKVGDPYQRN